MAISNADGSIVLTTKVDQTGLKKGMSTMKSGASALSGQFKKLGATVAAAFSVKVLIDFSKESSNLATQTEASVQRLVDIYGSASKAVGDFIDANSNALGMSRAAAASYASVYGNLFSVWADQVTNAKLTNQYLNMTAVVASKTGRTVEDVQERIRSGLLGNTEAIEDLGVFVNVKTIETTDAFKRMADGRSWDQLDAYTQQQIRTFAILEQATSKYGDQVAQTSALEKSQFQAVWQDFQATWGQVVNRVLMPVLEVLTDILVASTAAMQSLFGISSSTISQATEIKNAKENQNDLTKAVEETNEATKKTLAGFDDIQILSSEISQDTGTEPIIHETSNEGLGDIFEIKETKKEMSAFEKALKKSFEKTSKIIKEAWNSEPVQAFWKSAKTYGGFLRDYWSTLGTSLWENLKTTWENIKFDFGEATSNMSGLWTTFWQDIRVGIDTWGQPIIDGVNGVFNSIWTTAIDPYIQLMTKSWSNFTGILLDLWNEHGKPLLNNIGEFVNTTIGLFQSIYDNVLDPIITPFLETLSWLWEKHLSKMVYALGDFIMSLINGVLEIYNKFIEPFVKYLLKKIAPAWSYLSNLVIGVAGTIIGTISDLITGLLEILTGLVDFIVGVFTGNWKKAWEGVASVFKGIWDGIWGVAKGVINLIIDALNSFVAGINKIKFDVPEWVPVIGGEQWGFNIPKIPKLAQGAVIPPNREFLAVLGDQKQGTNIETPLATMVEAFQTALDSRGGYNNGNIEVVLEIDGREFGRAAVEQGNRESRRIGTSLVMVK